MSVAREVLGLKMECAGALVSALHNTGVSERNVALFAVRYSTSDATRQMGKLRAEYEKVEILDIPLDIALSMVTDGFICEARTVILLHHAALDLISGDCP
ncbi:MAG: hypothetical protein GDA36_01165 [Rhodobacteraceae bacterium]|nr:hypothetical protein [Paracoccaceae bacterium]